MKRRKKYKLVAKENFPITTTTTNTTTITTTTTTTNIINNKKLTFKTNKQSRQALIEIIR
jgi:hypothetical protein